MQLDIFLFQVFFMLFVEGFKTAAIISRSLPNASRFSFHRHHVKTAQPFSGDHHLTRYTLQVLSIVECHHRRKV